MSARMNQPGLLIAILCALILFGIAGHSMGEEIKGLIEPIKSVKLATEESGEISQVLVREGQQVNEGDVLTQLEDRIQQVQLELAQHLAESAGSLQAAESSLRKRELITQRIRKLREEGNASASELIRSEMELDIAKSRFLSAKEELTSRQIELRQAEIQLLRRKVVAPFDGTVTRINYSDGEYLSPLKPELLTLVQTDELLGVFQVPVASVANLKHDQQVTIYLAKGRRVTGSIYSIAAVADGGSGTVTVKVKIDNSDGKIRSGESCFLNV